MVKKLNFCECIELINTCIENKILSNNGKKNKVLVYREAGAEDPEGWYLESIWDVATELTQDIQGQIILKKELKKRLNKLS